MASGLLGGFLINSRTVMDMSFSPSWLLWEKCCATGLSCRQLAVSLMCSYVRLYMFLRVWPTYCMPHLLHVIAYIRLLLLHDTLIMVLCLMPVALLVMLPDLLRSLQYVHPFLLQNAKPLSFLLVPCWVLGMSPVDCDPLGTSGASVVDGVMAAGGVLGVTKSNIDLCLGSLLIALTPPGRGGGGGGVGGGAT